MSEEILTLPYVAALLRVAQKTVYTLSQRAELPAFKVGGQWRFKRADIDQWIEDSKRGVPAAAVQTEQTSDRSPAAKKKTKNR